MATERGMPACSNSRTATRRRSWNRRPGTPALRQATCQLARRSLIGEPGTREREESIQQMKLTGHRSEAVYRRYAIVSEADLRVAVERLAAARSRG